MKIVKADHKGIALAVKFLKAGKAVAYPTDTSYGLAVDATSAKAIKRLYKIKGRGFNKPVHVVVPSLAFAKKIVVIDKRAEKLFKFFLPGPVTLVLPLIHNSPQPPLILRGGALKLVNYSIFKRSLNTVLPLRIRGRQRELERSFLILSAGKGTLGIRMPKNHTALFLAKSLGRPITATSANIAGSGDSYTVEDIIKQFAVTKFQPDLILDAGILKKVKPSTVVDLTGQSVKILRKGPIALTVIIRALGL